MRLCCPLSKSLRSSEQVVAVLRQWPSGKLFQQLALLPGALMPSLLWQS